ncbi:MAG: Holliday junction branch migration protein RuvA [Spirochaetota bacterium]
MIASITGVVTHIGDGSVRLQCGAFEVEAEVSDPTAGALSMEKETVRLLTILHHREDSMRLYGFLTEEERELFTSLQSVNGIGPKQALRILSGERPSVLREMIKTGNVAALAGIKGVGPKTAQRLIVALEGRIPELEPDGASPKNDIVRALIEMGFDRRDAQDAVMRLSPELQDEAELLRRCIIELT